MMKRTEKHMMRARFLSLSAMLTLTAVAAGNASGGENPDLLFHTGHAPADIRFAGLAGSGCALPTGVLSAFYNPALIHSVAKQSTINGLLTGLSYAQQTPMYDRHVVTLGAAYGGKEQGTVGNLYRYMQGDDEQQTDYQTMATYAGQLFDKSSDQGPVDYGVNIRYDQANWNTYGHPTLYSTLYAPGDTTVYDSSTVSRGNILEKRLLLDLGFYQSSIMNNLDFGLVLHNLFGYTWGEQRPTVESVYDSLGADSIVYGRRCTGEYHDIGGWIDSWYRRVTIGVLFHSILMEGNLVLRIPLDVEVIGLFNRDGPDRVWRFRCGAEATYRTHFVFRLGYARRPWLAEVGVQPENAHRFTGGFALQLRSFTIDSYLDVGEQRADNWGVGEWGLAASYVY